MTDSKSRERLMAAARPLTLADKTAAARAFKAQGGRVVGFLSNNVPVELIHAAGCFPLQLAAVPGEPTPLGDRYMESLFDPMARSVFEHLLRGDFAFVDLLVLPRTVDSFQRMYYYLCELRRTGALAVPETWLYDLLHTPWYTSAEYNFARTVELKQRLDALSGKEVTDDQLRASIAFYNRIRDKLGLASARRRSVPCELSGVAALELFSASQWMRPEAFEAELDGLLASQPPRLGGPRVVLIGSAHDEPIVHRMVARLGGQVVGDYHWRGELLLAGQVDQDLPPLRALSCHYHRDSFSPRRFPSSASADADAIVEFVQRAQADAAVFFYYAEEEALTWDFPAQRRALDRASVPSLCLSDQPYPADASSERLLREFLGDLQKSAIAPQRPRRIKVEAS
jgi:benzoyl-CoA reductase/2-hydroxyglutaryl-CoA dehydratase subunit BcrC/BadD/HgdB